MAGCPSLVGHDDALTILRSCRELVSEERQRCLSETTVTQGPPCQSAGAAQELSKSCPRAVPDTPPRQQEGSARLETASCLAPITTPEGRPEGGEDMTVHR